MPNRKKVEMTCPVCGQIYFKVKSEVIRNEKIGRISYCSISCGSKARMKDPKIKEKLKAYNNSDKNKKHLKEISNNKRDDLTPFRILLKSTRQRKNHKNDLDLEFLKTLWEEQNGICPYSGVQLILPEYKTSNEINPIYRASIDRIDSSLGYIKGNVQFTSTSINYMKNSLSDKEVKDFINIIIQNNSQN